MELRELTYRGPQIDDPGLLAQLPEELRALLEDTNGWVQFHGGLHVRGACCTPGWHSLREAMEGARAFHRLYPEVVDVTDIPFAQDCSGDQFLIRGGEVHQLAAEVGEVDPLDMTLSGFLERVQTDPVEMLCMHPLLQYRNGGGRLEPGRLLLAYPPFCTGHSGADASIRAVTTDEAISFHADLARRIQGLDGGDELTFQVGQ